MSKAHEVLLQERWTDEFAGSVDAAEQPDRRDGSLYHLTPDLATAIKVAMVTYRPLLLRGDPGTGKSSLAAYIARNFGWRYYEHVVTARTEARDLLYTYDAVRRLADAQALGGTLSSERRQKSLDPARYVDPGPLWWALDPASARRRGLPELPRGCPAPVEPNAELNRRRSAREAVLLIDEVDKADPDVPNSLLVALGSNVFQVAETGCSVSAAPGRAPAEGETRLAPLLVVITTNEERDLPKAFLRRCITYTIRLPETEEEFVKYMQRIADLHRRRDGVKASATEDARATVIARRLFAARAAASKANERPSGTAEYLDAVRACRELQIDPGQKTPVDPVWALVEHVTLRKSA